MSRYRRKPIVFDAVQFLDPDAPPEGVHVTLYDPHLKAMDQKFHVTTIHKEEAPVVVGDWIMPEIDGKHFRPCKPDVFAATYEPVDE